MSFVVGIKDHRSVSSSLSYISTIQIPSTFVDYFFKNTLSGLSSNGMFVLSLFCSYDMIVGE